MKHSGTTIRLVIASLTLLLVATAAFAGGEQEGAASDQPFVIARSTDARTLDPGYAYSEGEIDLMFHLYDGLVRFVNDELDVEPALATSWETSDDGTVWTFELREGVKFHDGTDFNAEAVVFSFNRLIDEDHPYYGLGSYSYFDYLLSDAIDSIEAIDEYTVRFTLSQPFAPFLTYLGYYSEFVVSPTAVREHGENFFRNPVGTGPFEFVEWQKDEYITIRRNEDYWGEQPTVDEVIWKVVPDASTRLLELRSGQAHAIKGIVPNQLETIEGNDDLAMHRVAGANVFMAVFNNDAEPVDDPRVRQAIRHGIDLEALVDSVYGGLGTGAATPMPPTVFGFADDLSHYDYDPERSRELLAEAGYPDGISLTIHSFIQARPYVPKPLDAAQIMESQLAEAGIDVTVESNEWGTHSDIMDNHDHQMALTGWYDVPYPSNFLRTMLLVGSDTNWQPQEMTDLSLSALATYDRDEQERIYREMQAITHEESPVIPIAHSDYTAASRVEVEGLELDVIGTIRAHNVQY